MYCAMYFVVGAGKFVLLFEGYTFSMFDSGQVLFVGDIFDSDGVREVLLLYISCGCVRAPPP